MGRDRALAAIARRQHGAFTTAQAIDAGFTSGAIRQRLKSGAWGRVRTGVYALGGAPRTADQSVMGAVLALGTQAVTSHGTAARLLGLLESTSTIVHITLPPGQHRRRRAGIVLHEAQLESNDIRRIEGVPVTCPNRTLVDLASVVTKPALEAALDDAIQAGLTTVRTLRRYIEERRLEHLRGMKTLRELLDDRLSGSPQKALERLFIKKLRGTDLPKPSRQFRVRSYKVDFVYRDPRIAIELDGLATHFSGEAFRADRRRQNELVLEGWIPLRFTWDDVNQSWPRVEATIRAALGPR